MKSGSSVLFYKNGVQLGATKAVSDAMNPGTGNKAFGIGDAGNDRPFVGNVSHAFKFSRALTAGEIAGLSADPDSLFTTGP